VGLFQGLRVPDETKRISVPGNQKTLGKDYNYLVNSLESHYLRLYWRKSFCLSLIDLWQR
jgi:hypothetical protein